MSFVGKLYGFQEKAAEFMLDRGKVLVAYEMGLGKTPITIYVIETLIDEGLVSSGLIVTPASLKYQWERQINKFAPDATVIVIDGSPKKREALYSDALSGEYDYIILNYEQIVNDWDKVKHLPRDFVVCDEVTAIKSFKSKRARRVKRLQAPYLFGLSGQPIENKPEEAYSIMQWVDEDVLGRFDLFDRTFIVRNAFGGVMRYRNLPTFRKKMVEAMVRKVRTDPDVRDQLPKVAEESHLIEFDRAGATLYKHMARDLQADLAEAMGKMGSFDLFSHYSPNQPGGSKAEMAMRGKIMSKLTCLRMLCDHPELLAISARLYDASQVGGTGVKGGSAYAYELQAGARLKPAIQAPKFKECMALVTDILAADPASKVVLFSFFKPTLRMLQVALAVDDIGSVQFTGDMNAKAKDKAKQTFQDDPKVRVFLSSDAGGYGVDLPEANYLINYDLPWSAGKLDQRNARIVRLSSEWEAVTVINLLMRGSIEERQYALLEQKRMIASAFIDGKGFDSKGRLNLDLATLTDFLSLSTVGATA